MGRSKRFKEIDGLVEADTECSLRDAVELLKKCPPTKFDQSVDIQLKLGVDPRKSDQQVRSTVSLPHGTGRTARVLVFAKGDKATEAVEAGADQAGAEELLEKVAGGWTDFDSVIATPDMMREVGKLGKILGPRGLMPTPKAGTVTMNVGDAVKDIKAGKVEFRCDRDGGVHVSCGRLSFSGEALCENVEALIQAIWRAKPSSAKGIYFRSGFLSSTMGPGIKLEGREFPAA
jgi:large subunit ribosomal protein L1